MRNTRISEFNFSVPRIRSCESKTFFYNAISDWNSLPFEIKKLKSYLVQKLA